MVWRILTGLSNTLGMDWNTDCEPDLITLYQRPSKPLAAEWGQMPAARFQNIVGAFQNDGSCLGF